MLMKLNACILFILFPVLMQNIVPMTVSGDDSVQSEGNFSEFLQLKTTLSKLYPIEESSFALEPTLSQPIAPRFCWKFYRPDVVGYENFVNTVLSYQGRIRWVFGPEVRGMSCICATEADNRPVDSPTFVGYPPISSLDDNLLKGSDQRLWPSKEFIDRTILDIPRFVAYLEKSLGLETLSPKLFDPKVIVPSEPPPSDSIPPDFLERGMHVTWIIQRQSEQQVKRPGSKASIQRKMLHFGVTEEEWHSIYSIVLDGV